MLDGVEPVGEAVVGDMALARPCRLLDRVGLIDHADNRGDALSGGQRQRVGITRALAQEPELLLVDEPTASLDPKTSRQIMRLLIEIFAESGPPAIVSIHDVPLAQQFVQRSIGLRAGRVVFDGPPSELTETALTTIYGAEDWTATRKGCEEDAAADRETPGRWQRSAHERGRLSRTLAPPTADPQAPRLVHRDPAGFRHLAGTGAVDAN